MQPSSCLSDSFKALHDFIIVSWSPFSAHLLFADFLQLRTTSTALQRLREFSSEPTLKLFLVVFEPVQGCPIRPYCCTHCQSQFARNACSPMPRLNIAARPNMATLLYP
eukprot:Gb_21045 [translate_table: standard]